MYSHPSRLRLSLGLTAGFWVWLTTSEEFEHGGLTLRMPQMFSVHATPQEFKNAAITDHFGFMVEENSALQEIQITWLS